MTALQAPVDAALVETAAEAAYHAGMTFRGNNIVYEEWSKLPDYWKQIFRAQARAVLGVLS